MEKWRIVPLACLLPLLSIACDGGGGNSGGSASPGQDGAVLSSPSPEALTSSGYVAHDMVGLPLHYREAVDGFGRMDELQTEPAENPITDAGAALGRLLFYDRQLSKNQRVSCASCHKQESGFSDRDRFSRGFDGQRTDRHSPGLSNVSFYGPNRFFWDERADGLEAQVLQPIENPVEMGLPLPELVARLESSPHYPGLFQAAFGDDRILEDRISKALAQFLRSMVSYQSLFDAAFSGNNLDTSRFNTSQALGLELFRGQPGEQGKAIRCDACHMGVGTVSRQVENIGLDAITTDPGAGEGRFKAPSLRNVGVRGPFMHDGRFETLEAVIEHYDSGIQDHPNLNPFLRDGDGAPLRLQFTPLEKTALVDFLHTLTDESFLNNPLFANPFPKRNHQDRDGGRVTRGERKEPRHPSAHRPPTRRP